MITIDTEKSTTTDIHFIVDTTQEKEFVDNNENIQKVLKLYLEGKHFKMVKQYQPKYRKTKSGFVVPYGKSIEEFSIEVNNSLLWNKQTVKIFENIVNEQYRVWRKYNYE